MKSVLDTVMIILFVLFMVFLIRGFMLQSAQKRRDKRSRKED
jgi:preprotein translocase subunit YajC